jgi:formylmethanofuran dehydrogenase subunit B
LSEAPARGIACPFCGLACDDLLIGPIGVETRGCAKAAAGFAAQNLSREHRVGGERATLDQAIEVAAGILRGARLPLITGLSVDLAGAQALVALADRCGAVIDRWQADTQVDTQGVVQREGALTATFGEVANRADVVLIVGPDPARDYPRLYERLVANKTPLYRNGPPAVIHIGPPGAAPSGLPLVAQVPVETSRLLDALRALSALIDGRRAAGGTAPDLPLAPLGDLAGRLHDARYGAIIWDAANFAAGEGDLCTAMVLSILRSLNRKTRCVGLPLGGSGNSQGVAQVMLWQAGWPSRLCFAGGSPAHDPWRFQAERLLSSGEADALLWVSTLAAAAPPVATVPTIAVVAPHTTLRAAPAVEIRVGMSGLDHGGTILRADTVIAVPLSAARPSDLPSVAAVASALLPRLGAAA